jgi:hypothetical protein
MKNLLVLVGMLLATCAWAQTERATITGVVRDAVSDKPIDLVTVYIKGSNTAAESAENGRYSITVPAN